MCLIKCFLYFLMCANVMCLARKDSCNFDCACEQKFVSCIRVYDPKFTRNFNILNVYMENVRLLEGLDNIIWAFPNLRILNLNLMNGFDCEWLQDLPTDINAIVPQCKKTG